MRNARCCDGVFGRIARGRERRNSGAVALPSRRPEAFGLIVRKSRARNQRLELRNKRAAEIGAIDEKNSKNDSISKDRRPVGYRASHQTLTKRSPTWVALPRIRRFRFEFDQNQAKGGIRSLAELRREPGNRARLPEKIGIKNPLWP